MKSALLVLLILCLSAFAQTGPDIQVPQTFIAATAGAAISNGGSTGAANFRLTFRPTGFTAATVQVETAEDCAGVACATWTAIASANVIQGSNPIVWAATDSPPTSQTMAFVFTHPWYRVNVTHVTGVGMISTLLLGYRGAANGGFAKGGGGGGGSFATLTGGTNTTAAMVVGAGASLSATGGGTIAATSCPGCAAPTFNQIGSGTNTTATMTVGAGASLNASGGGTIAATTSSASDHTPTLCPTGQAPTGVDASFNATACAPIGGGSGGGVQVFWFNHTVNPFTLPTSTLTGVYGVNAATPSITRNDTGSGGSFITDGWQAGMQVAASGFTTGANNESWFIKSVAAGALTLTSVSTTGCATCNPVYLAMVTEAPVAQTVTLTVDREEASPLPPTIAETDESVQIITGDGNVPIDSYTTVSASPAQTTIPVGDWTFNDWVYVNSTAGGSTTVFYSVLKVSTTGAETALFDTSGTPTTINQTSYQNVIQTYTVSSPISILSTDRIIVRPTFNDGTVNPKIVHHVYGGNTHAGYIITTFPATPSTLPFSAITTATNSGQTLTVGAGATMTASGGGQIIATSCPTCGSASLPAWLTFTAPPVSGWTLDNGTGSSLVFTAGYPYLTTPQSGGTNLVMAYRTAPGTPYTATAAMMHDMSGWQTNSSTSNATAYGLAFRDSTGKIITLGIGWTDSGGTCLGEFKWNSSTSFSGITTERCAGAANAAGSFRQPTWLQIQDNGTNLIGLWSLDALTWNTFFTESRTAFFGSGPNAIGFFAYNNGAGVQEALMSWTQ